MHRPIQPYHGTNSKYWILVADGDGAKILSRHHVQPGEAGPDGHGAWGFEPLPDFRYSAESLSSFDLGRNAISSVFESFAKLRHHSAPHVDLRRKRKDDLAAKVAKALNHAKHLHRFDELVVIAPPAWLGTLRAHLSGDVRNSISLEIAKDLTRLAPPRLSERLHQLLPLGPSGYAH